MISHSNARSQRESYENVRVAANTSHSEGSTMNKESP